MLSRKAVRIALPALALCLCASAEPISPISFGPDSVVDSLPWASYVEPSIAVSPKDPRKLIAGSMVFGASGITMQPFRSDDGGSSWRSAYLPIGSGDLLGDVQAAFDSAGRAYMTGLGSVKSADGHSRNGLYVFASSNAGDTFERIAFLQTPDHHSYDHEQLAIDRTNGPYRGRVYMTVLYSVRISPQLNGLGMLWSSDGGRTFQGPVEVSRGWSFNSRPLVLHDGTVLFPLIHTQRLDDTTEHVQMCISHDGGRTFSKPYSIGTRIVYSLSRYLKKMKLRDYAFDADSVPQFAASKAQPGRPREIYGIWSDMRWSASRLVFTRSADGGKHWTQPRVVLASSDSTDAQYQPSIAVNADGVMGISWFNGSAARNSVYEMFAISRDGGRSFSMPEAISSSAALLRTPAEENYSGDSFADEHGIFISFVPPGGRYPSGGDYMDLSADNEGAFHPVWIDARTGVYQVWTTTVFPSAPAADPPALSEHIVTKHVGVDFGVGNWDAAAHELTIPARLHNISTMTLYPPLTVVVTRTTNPYDKRSKTGVTLLNADNGKPGVGATFTYTAKTLGNLGRLLPGAHTSYITWKVRIKGGAFEPILLTDVRAYTSVSP